MTATDGFTLEPGPTRLAQLVGDVWRARTLLGVLARKDFHVRYRRASLGLLWAVGLPVLQATVLAVVFGRFVSDDVPHYAAFVLAGTVAWTFVSSTVPAAATSIVDGSDLSTRIYFPRALFPLVAVAANVYGFVLAIGVLLVGVVVLGVPIEARLVLLLPAAVVAIAFTTSLALVLAALHVYFRDVRYLVQAVLLAWFYVTPVIYPLGKAGDLEPWLKANPATGVVELFRAATVGAADGWLVALAATAAWTVVFAGLAVALYRRHDRVFVDLL